MYINCISSKHHAMKTLAFVIALLFACQGEAKKQKGVRFKAADGGIKIREVHDQDQSYLPKEHKETPHYFEDDYELESYEPEYHVPSYHGGQVVHYGPKYPHNNQQYKAYKKARKQAKKMNAKYKKNAYKRVKHAKYFQKWGKKLLKYAMSPVYGPTYDDYSFDSYDDIHYYDGKVEPEFVTHERPVYQNPKKPRLVEIRVPKCKPTVEVPYSVTETLIKKEPVYVTKTKYKTKHIKVTQYVVNTETVTQRLQLSPETVTKYYTVTQRNYEPSTPVYKVKHVQEDPGIYYKREASTPTPKIVREASTATPKVVREAPPPSPTISYANLMSSLMEMVAEVQPNNAKKTP